MEGSRQPFSPPVSPESMAREIAAFERALADSVAAIGLDAPATLAARARLGQAYSFADRFGNAVRVLTENLAASERALGADHPDTSVARSDLAWAWRRAGQVSDALTAQGRCLADLDRVLGPGSAEAAKARIEYARLQILTGQSDVARQHLEQAAADLDRSVGPEHPDALCCRMWLASTSLPRPAHEGVAAAEQTAAECARLLDPDDPEAISSRAMLGMIYNRTDRLQEALALLSSARTDFQRVLGPEHTESIRTGIFLAAVLRATGDNDRAIVEFEQTLDVAERVLEPQHRLTITARMRLALAYQEAGRPADAAATMERAIGDFEPVSIPDRTQARVMRTLHAGFLSDAGHADDAITALHGVIAEYEQAGDGADKRAVDARLLLAAIYSAASRGRESHHLYRRVLPDVRRVYGPDHAKTREVEQLIWRAHSLLPFRASRRPRAQAITSAAALIVILAVLAAFIAHWSTSPSPAWAAPPRPGYESPANAVAGYTAGFFTDHPAAACRYTAPSDRGLCTLAAFGVTVSGTDAELSGSWTIGHTVILGSQAIVDVEYEARGTTNGISVVNTNANAGLPHAGLSFDAAFQQVFSSKAFSFAVDCVLVDGRWYVDDAQQGS